MCMDAEPRDNLPLGLASCACCHNAHDPSVAQLSGVLRSELCSACCSYPDMADRQLANAKERDKTYLDIYEVEQKMQKLLAEPGTLAAFKQAATSPASNNNDQTRVAEQLDRQRRLVVRMPTEDFLLATCSDRKATLHFANVPVHHEECYSTHCVSGLGIGMAQTSSSSL